MVEEGAAPSGDPSTEPESPVWQQILTMMGNLQNLNTKAKENLVAAINEAAQSGGSPGTAESGGVPMPESAEAGQFLVVSAVDENGKVTATEAITLEDAEEVAF